MLSRKVDECKPLVDDVRVAMTMTENDRAQALLRINRIYVNEEEEQSEAGAYTPPLLSST